jgi:hypothetical protein
MVSAGDNHTCALDDEGVKCWGAKDFSGHPGKVDGGQTHVPADLKNPRYVVAGDPTSCALDDEGVKCWGEPKLENAPF